MSLVEQDKQCLHGYYSSITTYSSGSICRSTIGNTQKVCLNSHATFPSR